LLLVLLDNLTDAGLFLFITESSIFIRISNFTISFTIAMRIKRKLFILLTTTVLTLCLNLFNAKVKAQSIKVAKTPSNETFTAVEELPTFPNTHEDFQSFIKKNLDQTKASKAGRINITFIVEKDGAVSDVKAIGRIFDQNAADEAIRVLKLSPKWNPGKQNGKPVRVQYTVPVVFTK
jgi:hypothetical protein